jgi:plasmid maintenance system antidote protein VapI
MQMTDRDLELAAEFAETKEIVRNSVARRREIVADLLTRNSRAVVAELLKVSPQRVSEIVGGVRK